MPVKRGAVMLVDSAPRQTVIGKTHHHRPSSFGRHGAIVNNHTVQRLAVAQVNLPPGTILLAGVKTEVAVDSSVHGTGSVDRRISLGNLLKAGEPVRLFTRLYHGMVDQRRSRRPGRETEKHGNQNTAAVIHGS